MLEEKRIIFVLPSLQIGGAEQNALRIASYLHQEVGAKVQVWGLGGYGPIAKMCESLGIPWQIIRLTWPADYVMRLKALIRFTFFLSQAHPEILMPYTIRPNVVCGLVWRLTGARFCVWNQRDEGRSFGVEPKFQRSAIKLTPLFISNSYHGKNLLVNKLNAPLERIHVIHNGIKLTEPRTDRSGWRKELGVTDDCFLACMVANLHQYKDHATLLKAWRLVLDRLHEQGCTATLLLAGRFGNTYESLQTLAHELALGEQIQFLGYVEDVPGLLQAVDLSVFSSNFEGCPNAVGESMATGLPVVGSDSPGVREAVGEQGAAYLASPGDAIELAQRILLFAENPALRTEVGQINRRRIETEFSMSGMLGATVSLLERKWDGL